MNSSTHRSMSKISSMKYKVLTKCILCVDPSSKKFYLQEISTGKIVIIRKVPEDQEKRVERELLEMDYLTKEHNPVKYHLSPHSDKIRMESKDVHYEYEKNLLDYYKRRKLPKYLIALDRTDYSRYASKDDISIAYLIKGMESVEKDETQVTTEIDTIAHLENYTDLLNVNNSQTGFRNKEKNQGMNKLSRFQGRRQKRTSDFKVDIPLTLINSVNECVKKIIREACFKYGTVIKKMDKSKVWGLRLFDYEEYLYGDIPLINYYSVQKLIRDYKSLEVVVVEIPANASSFEHFPPIYNYPKESSIKQFEKRMEWDKVRKNPLFYWHAPRDLNKFERMERDQRNSKHQKMQVELMKSTGIFGQKKPSMLQNIGSRDTFLRPRAMIYSTALKFNEERYKTIKNKRRPLKITKLYTGECDFPFRLKIIGADNIQEIFRHYENECYYNGKQVPNCISHHPWKENYEKSMNRMGDKFSKIGKDIHTTKYMKAKAKKKKNKKAKESEVEEEYQNSSINAHLSKLPFLNHTPKKRDSHLYPLIQNLRLPLTPYLILPSIFLLLGDRMIHDKIESPPQPFSMNPRFEEMVRFGNLRVSQLPLETRVGFNLMVVGGKGDMIVIGCGQINLFDREGRIRQGRVEINVWPFYQLDSRMVCMGEYCCRVSKEAPDRKNGIPDLPKCTFVLQFDTYSAPMYYSLRDSRIMKELGFEEKIGPDVDYDEAADSNDLVQVNKILSQDPTNLNLSIQEKRVIIKARNHLKYLPNSLSVFLMAINWIDPEEVKIVLEELHEWKQPEHMEEYVPILDVRFHNEFVRMYAVQNISKMTDKDIELYLLNFTMALAYEPEPYNPLTEFLLERSVKNYSVVGTKFYWMIRAWLHWKITHIRYTTILEQLIFLIGSGRKKLLAQLKINEKMKNLTSECQKHFKKTQKLNETIREHLGDEIDNQIKLGVDIPPKEVEEEEVITEDKIEEEDDNLKNLKEIIQSDKIPEEFTFPHDSRLKSVGFSPSECKVFSSKKAPMLLSTLNCNTNAPNYETIFKLGDDLKQDILTLQILKLFDKWWLEAGLDLKMSPYKVLNTQDMIGYIEYVQNSDTMKEIFDKHGGSFGTFDKYVVMKFLESNNRRGLSLDIALENFRRSVAGYCLLTYVMGVGDRHISNYMINKDGKFFHIDFGHILGNFKKKFMFNRERSKVVFTKEMVYTIGKESEEYFFKLCFYGMSILRKKSHLLLNLLWMLVSADMPNLRSKENLNWVKDSLLLNGNDTEASEKFKKVLEEGYNDNYRRFDNWIHKLRHRKKKNK